MESDDLQSLHALIEQALQPARHGAGRPILDVSLRGSRSRQGWDCGIPNQLLLVLQVGVMMMMVVMAVVYYHHDLRLCRVGYRETEDEHETEQSLFHDSVCRLANLFTELL
jgi:hypothetical protein